MGDLRLKIVHKYYMNFCLTCDVRELHNTRFFLHSSWSTNPGSSRYRAETDDYTTLKFQEQFVVPRLKKPHESQNRIKKYQLVEAFISFLLQLLHPEEGSIDWKITSKCKDKVKKLEKELRFLLTVLGDIPLLVCDEHEEFQNLLAEFEAVANEVGNFVRSCVSPTDRGLVFFLVFPPDPAYAKLDEDFDVVFKHIDLLKTNIMKFFEFLSSISTSACITPRTPVVDSLLIVDSLIYDLEDLTIREDNRNGDVKNQIKRLHRGLIVTRSSVKDIGSPQPSQIGELKEPLMRIGDMAHQAEYLITSFLVRDAPLPYLITRLTHINDKIELIATELTEITKKYKSGGLKVAKYFGAQLSLHAKGNTVVDDVTIGFEDSATNILDQLVGGGTERLQVISIFGMPGLGKTTLAKKLYNHPSVIYWFDKLSWCVVSQTYLRQSILASILIDIKSEFEKDTILKMEEESLVEHIYKTLKGRRYLIVMDDIWDSNVWDNLRRCFPDDENGSRILFTTRNKEVAPPNSIIYAQPSLSKDQCWELLKKKVFHDKPCPPELVRIGKKIAANCYGLPLAVVVIAGILSTMDREKSTWEEVGGNLASYIFDGGDNSLVMQILELSYKHLPDHLRPCFLYFGAFEENREILAKKLMRLWIVEGFVRKEEEKSAENVAEEYLMELIDKSLVMVTKRGSDGGVKACVIHDLLRELCFKICEEENFLKFEKSNIDFMLRKHETAGPRGLRDSATWSYCQHIRSFHGSWLTLRLYVRDMRLLRVLESKYPFKQLIGIEFLVNLKYLVVGDLPASIGRLVNLEYLRVETIEKVYLCPSVMKLKKLRYIHVLQSEAIYDIRCNSSLTNNLEFLSCLGITELKDEEMLKCSPHLRKLKCKLEPLATRNYAYRHFDLSFLTQLESLHVFFFVYGMEEISFPTNIKKLTLRGVFFHKPRNMMPIIGKLENLEVLKLGSGVVAEERWNTRDGEFQKLRFLKLDHVGFTQWNVDSSQHFPKLQRLILSDCHSLQEIPYEIGEVAALQLIEVKGKCQKSLVESAQRIKQEQCDMGNEELRVIISNITYTPEVTPPNKAKRLLQKLFRSCF